MKVNKKNEKLLNQKQIQKLLNYNSDTGVFKWKIKRKNLFDKKAGCLCKDGYIIIKINQISYRAHRLAWLYVYGKFPDKYIDHINRIKDDNRICNLRDVNHSINCHNIKLQKDNTSGYKGICWDKQMKMWKARISFNNKRINLGYYNDIKDAIKIYNKIKYKMI